jgi:hypothetical protein
MNRTADAFSAVLNARWSLIYEVNVVFEIKWILPYLIISRSEGTPEVEVGMRTGAVVASRREMYVPFSDLPDLPVLLYLVWSRVSSGSIVSDYGLDDRAIGVRFPAGPKDFSYNLCVQTGSGAHPVSCTLGTGGSFPRVKRGRGVTLTTHPHLVPRSWMSRSSHLNTQITENVNLLDSADVNHILCEALTRPFSWPKTFESIILKCFCKSPLFHKLFLSEVHARSTNSIGVLGFLVFTIMSERRSKPDNFSKKWVFWTLVWGKSRIMNVTTCMYCRR